MINQSATESPNERMLREAFEKRFGANLEARGEARMLLRILTVRKLPIDDATRAKILACSESPVLERWAERALTATTIAEIFG